MDPQKNLFILFGEWLQARQTHRQIATPIQTPRRLTGWLPTPGTVIFTLAMIALLIAAQSVGALPLGRPLAAPEAASTGTIAYQGRLADAAGAPITDTVNMTFRLYTGATGGTPLWSEPWTGSNGVKVSDGLFNVMLGSLTALPQSAIAGRNQLFLGITVGTDDEMQPRVQLGSVPFAVQALTVPDGSVTTAKLSDSAVTSEKLRPITGDGGISPCCITLTENYQDIPGTERTISIEVPSIILIDATFDYAMPPGGATAVGNVTLDGIRLGRQAIASGAGIRVTAGTAVRLELEPGTHRIGLSAIAGGTAGTQVVHHTGYTFIIVSR